MPIEPVEGTPKRSKTIAGSKEITMLAAKNISDIYKNFLRSKDGR